MRLLNCLIYRIKTKAHGILRALGRVAFSPVLLNHGSPLHSTQKGVEIGGKPVSRGGAALFSIRAPYPRPLIALSQRFRSCTRTSLLSVRHSRGGVRTWLPRPLLPPRKLGHCRQAHGQRTPAPDHQEHWTPELVLVLLYFYQLYANTH